MSSEPAHGSADRAPAGDRRAERDRVGRRHPLIGILTCDHVEGADLIEAAGGLDYHAMYTALLTAAEPHLDTRAYDVVNGELPEEPDECDGWIVTGSRHDAYGTDPWIEALRRFVRLAHDQRARMVGVCFGHQVMAHALGGEAAPAGRWKAGPQEMTVEATHWFEGGTVWLNAMHRDVVRLLPPQATTIAVGTTADCPAYLIDDSVLGVQDHPEFDHRYTAAIVEARRLRLGDGTADAAITAMAEVGNDGAVVGRWIVDFLLDRRLDRGSRSTAR